MQVTGWSRGLEVSGSGQGVVSHAGVALLRYLADKTGLACVQYENSPSPVGL